MGLQLVFVMDPPEIMDIDADTTFALAFEAQERGHRIYHADPADLGVNAGRATARIQPLALRRERGAHMSLEAGQEVVLDDVADVVWQRKDPPVDAEYVVATQILTLCHRATVLNRPEGILAANEKLYALHFPELMAETLVTASRERLLGFLDELGGEMIVKPLDGRGGEGIFVLRRGDPNLHSLLEQSTAFGTRRAMAQRFLPEVREGDKRVLLLDGEPLGAVLRVPADGEARANLHVGGRAAAATLDDADRRIVERIAPSLRRDGLFFVGIDVIGGRLTEINVTSPTGIQEMTRLDGTDYSARVIDAVEARAARNSDG
ncbi:MAG: glutathione synthase [Myxococcales bacterium]|nr:glutathione synthase [Myxococcales bacterium]